jgi:hypothetical protein
MVEHSLMTESKIEYFVLNSADPVVCYAPTGGGMTHLRSSVERTDRWPRRPSCYVTR